MMNLNIRRGLLLLACAVGIGTVSAQNMQLPLDSAVVVGTLPNGLTYYIRHNEYPKGQADFYIAQKVGSVLEEDDQRGLAHFLEHMCFNGTKNFPGNQLTNWLESIGVKFGMQLNAYTSTDRTVYNICSVPTARPEVTDSVLLILHDWANDLTLDPAEIDKERGVIHEEWRSRNGGQTRILEQALPTIYPGSKYAYRMPIGTMEVVDNFPYQALRDYYEKWYRPDLQGIMVCGDIDAKRTEEVIKQMFSGIEMPANAAVRTEFDVPDTPGTIYFVGKDKEQTNSMAYIIFKQDVMPQQMKGTVAQVVVNYITSMMTRMLESRFNEMTSDPSTPFAFAVPNYGEFLLSSTKDCFEVITAAKGNDIREAIAAAYREVLRAQRGGFTASEYDRARQDYLAFLEKRYNNRNTQETSSLVNAMVDNFINQSPMMSIDDEYELMQQISSMIDVNIINQTFQEMITDDNRVVICMLPENESVYVPSTEEVEKAMTDVNAEQIDVFVDNVRQDPLIPSLAKPGKITKITDCTEFAPMQCWTLSNGAKVYVKKTDIKDDEICFTAMAPTGTETLTSSITPSDYMFLGAVQQKFGIGTYSDSDLQKYVAGKQVSLTPEFSEYTRTISGTTTPRDLSTLMELIYGYFTSVTYQEDEFTATQHLYAGLLENQELDPQFIFSRDLQKSLYASPYKQVITANDVRQASRENIEKATRAMVSDAGEWSFTFTGNFNVDTLKALCTKYIANLPAPGKGKKLPAIKTADGFVVEPGSGTQVYTTKMETPQTYCAVISSDHSDITSKDAKIATIAGQILSARLLANIREEMGAVYSISASGSVDDNPTGLNVSLLTAFPMNPEKTDEVLKAIKAEFAAMAQEVTPEELGKVKEFMLKSYAERINRNSALASYAARWTVTGVDYLNNAQAEVSAITPADIQQFMQKLNAADNYRVVLLNPEN